MRHPRRGARAAGSFACAVAALGAALSVRAAPTEEAPLTASDGEDGDQFGSSVAVFGDTAVVGAQSDDVTPVDSAGSAYVFTRAGTAWTQRKRLVAEDRAANDLFGVSTAVQGDTIAVGAQGVIGQAGAVYVFTGSGANWILEKKLTADDATAFSRLGQSVAIDGNTVVAGAPANASFKGAAYVFTRSGAGVWTQQAKLVADDGAASDQFGASVAIEGDTILVGSIGHDVAPGSNQGGVYVFTRNGTAWTQRKVLVADDGLEDDFFGISVALSGTTAIVGAQLHDVGQKTNQGAAYVFTGSGAAWTKETKLFDADGGPDDSFGISVAVEGDTSLVGAIFRDVTQAGSNEGAATVFKRTGATWQQQETLTASDLAGQDQFGVAVALDDGTALVGAVGKSSLRGAAYVSRGLPAAALGVTTTKGSITDSAKASKDAVSVTCKVEFRPNSGGNYHRDTDKLRVLIGNPASPFVLEVAAGDPAVKSKLNGKKQTLTHTWKSAKGVHPKASFKLVVRPTGPAVLTATAAAFDLPAGAASGLVRVQVEIGADEGHDADAWRTKGTKRTFR